MTKRIRDFNPKVDVSTPTKDGSRIKDPEEFQTQLESLLNTVEQFQVKFQTIGSRLDRDQDVTSEWLKIVREFGNDSTFTEYFQWEVDRLTQELQEATDKTDNSLQETLKEQYERWNKLLNATSDGLGRLI